MPRPVASERVRALLEHTLDAIAIIEADGTVSYASPSIARVLGYSPDEFAALAPFEAVHPDDRNAAAQRFAAILGQPGGTQTVLNRARHRDGSWRWIETVSTNQLENPTLRAIVASFRDVTERRRIEEALHERDEHFRLIVESAVDFAIFTLGLDGRIVTWNSGAERILGYTEDEILGQHVSVIFTSEDNARGRAELEIARAAEDGHENDDRWHMKKGGARFWANGMMMPLKEADGTLKGYLKIIRDRTEQKLAKDALRQSEERLRIAVNAVRLGLWHCALPLDRLDWDERGKEHFGLAPDADITFEAFRDRLHPDDRDRTLTAVERALDRHEPYDIECRTVSADGRVRWIRAIGEGSYDDSGPPHRLDGVTMDITERKQAEEALKDADRRKDEFLAMLAHELRNPLGAINNAVRVLLRAGRPEDLEWSKDVIVRQTTHLGRLIDDLLDVSRITRGKIQLRNEPIDLGPVIARAVEVARPLLEEKRHTLSLAIAPGRMRLLADPTRLEQVLVNLLTNAAKYTDDGGHITVTAEHNANVVVTVKDDGVGIAPELLPHVFDLFTQADRSIDRAQGGLGIGLTLVKRLVEMHGGTASAASAGPGRGSEFALTLPLVADTLDERSDVAEPTVMVPAITGVSALVVDDNQDSALGMARLLRASGFRVTTVHDGQSALETARAERPDVILMDIGLPRIDGYGVAKLLREDERCRDAVLIAISGYGQEQDRRRARDAGFDHHLVKPVDYDHLLALVTRPRQRSILPIAQGSAGGV